MCVGMWVGEAGSSPGSEVTDRCESHDKGVRNQNSGPLEEQQVFKYLAISPARKSWHLSEAGSMGSLVSL